MDRYLHIRPTNQKPDESMTSSEPTNPKECTAGHLLMNVNVISSITPAKMNDNRAERTTHLIINSFTIELTSNQTTVTNKTTTPCRQRSIYVVRTLNRHWKLTECAHRPTNGHRHHYYLSNEQLIDVIKFRKAASPVEFVLHIIFIYYYIKFVVVIALMTSHCMI